MLLREDDMITRQIADFGGHTRPELAMVLSLINPGDVVLDAGAHIGSFTIPFAQKVGAAGKVISIEPDEDNYDLLCRNIALNDVAQQVDPRCGLVASQPGKYAKFQFNAANTGTYYFMADAEGAVMNCFRLDDFGQDRIAFVKVDVEGMELVALQSAQTLIENFRPYFYVEVNAAALHRAGATPRSIHEFFQQRQYNLYQNSEPRNATDDCFAVSAMEDSILDAGTPMYDVLAVPREREAEFRQNIVMK